MLSRESRQAHRWDRGGVGKRLIKVLHQIIKALGGLRRDDLLNMPSTKLLRNLTCIGELAELFIFKSN